MSASLIVPVRKALVAGLDTQTGLEGVDKAFQWKAKWDKRERLWTQRARFNHTPASLRAGRNYRDEVGRFDLMILVEGVSKTAEWSAERALELGLVVEEYIADRKNNELGVPGMLTLVVEGDGSLTEALTDTGSIAQLIYPVRYTARLT